MNSSSVDGVGKGEVADPGVVNGCLLGDGGWRVAEGTNAERRGDGEGSCSGDRGKGDRAAGCDVDEKAGEDSSARGRVPEGEGDPEMALEVSACDEELASRREKSDEEAV